MQDLEELLAQMADARKVYGKELVAPYHGGNRVLGSEHLGEQGDASGYRYGHLAAGQA